MNPYEAELRRHLAEAHDCHPPEDWDYEQVSALHRQLLREAEAGRG